MITIRYKWCRFYAHLMYFGLKNFMNRYKAEYFCQNMVSFKEFCAQFVNITNYTIFFPFYDCIYEFHIAIIVGMYIYIHIYTYMWRPLVSILHYIYTLGMSLIFTQSIIQHKFYIDIRIKIALKVLIFSQAQI